MKKIIILFLVLGCVSALLCGSNKVKAGTKSYMGKDDCVHYYEYTGESRTQYIGTDIFFRHYGEDVETKIGISSGSSYESAKSLGWVVNEQVRYKLLTQALEVASYSTDINGYTNYCKDEITLNERNRLGLYQMIYSVTIRETIETYCDKKDIIRKSYGGKIISVGIIPFYIEDDIKITFMSYALYSGC